MTRPLPALCLLLAAASVDAQERSPTASSVLCDPATHPRPPVTWQGRFSEFSAALVARDFAALEALCRQLGRSPRDEGCYRNRLPTILGRLGTTARLDHLDAWCEAKPESAAALTARGHGRILAAWEARGYGWGHEVTEAGRRLMLERLESARTDLERALALDPSSPAAPAFLITVAMGLGLDHAKASRYLDLAVAADARDPTAYLNMVTYLLPKWYGRDGDALRFAMSVADAEGADPALCAVVTGALRRSCEHLSPQQQQAYFDRPPVSAELKRRYRRLLDAYPKARNALLGLEVLHRDLGETEERLRVRQRRIDLGEPDAMVSVGRCLEEGLAGLRRDSVAAVRLYCRAASLGSSEGKAELAKVFLEGKAGVAPDLPRGRSELEEAFEGGHVEAVFTMGRALMDGLWGYPRDATRGRQLIEQAAAGGHRTAIAQRGRWRYFGGKLEEGVRDIEVAAFNGDTEARVFLGRLAVFGSVDGGPPVVPDPGIGVMHLRTALAADARAREWLIKALTAHPQLRQPGDP